MESKPLLPINRKNSPTKRNPILILLLGLLCFITFYPQSTKSSIHQDWNDIRLPDFIKPKHYELAIDTNLDSFVFGGNVRITLEVAEKSTFIIVHQKDLLVEFQNLVPADDSADVEYSHTEYRPKEEYMVLFFSKPLSVGEYALELKFNGTLNNNMAGYYLSSYRSGSIKKYLATTQFESTSARLAFPCLDEPNKKAIFDISMTVDSKFHALSNMPRRSVVNLGTKTTYIFDPTVRMSTYLVAFIVSDFENISSTTSNGVKVSVWTAPNQSRLGEYALKVGVPILEFYQRTYGIDFPLPKMDMVAIPDFAAGAMENWGLVTYRDTALLYDPKSSTAANKQRVAEVVAHELAHQWFGNLVTMKWWSDLWLNEGFAEFMEYKAVNSVEPTWNMLDQFISLDLVRALHADESYYTHQIAIPVKNPDEISSIFDDISYGKGSSILRMLEAWFDEKYGKGVFFRKLHNYLAKFAYSNAETFDLWEMLRTDDQDVGSFMKTWTDQPGFPYLTFSNLDTSSVSVKQARFLFADLVNLEKPKDVLNQLYISHEPKNQVWSIPLSYAIYSNSSGTPQRLGRGFQEVSSLGDITVHFDKEYPADSIILANFAQTGVYHSLYDVKTYQYVTEWLHRDLEFLPAVERGGLISNCFSMTFSGKLKDPIISLELVQILAKDTNILVWEAALKDLESLKDVFALYPTYGPIVKFQTHLIEKIVGSIGWIETSPDVSTHHTRALLRGRILAEAVRNNHEVTVATALKYFKLFKEGNHDQIPVSADVFGAIYDAGVLYGDLEDYNFILNKFKESTFAPDQQLYLHALASSKTPYLQAKTLAFAISGEVRKQDIQGLIRQVATLSPVGHISTWLFLMDNWEKVTDIFEGAAFGKLSDLLKAVVGSFTKPHLINEAENLFIKQLDPDFKVPSGTKVAVLKGLETAKQLLAWRSLYGAKVDYWLASNGYN